MLFCTSAISGVSLAGHGHKTVWISAPTHQVHSYVLLYYNKSLTLNNRVLQVERQ